MRSRKYRKKGKMAGAACMAMLLAAALCGCGAGSGTETGTSDTEETVQDAEQADEENRAAPDAEQGEGKADPGEQEDGAGQAVEKHSAPQLSVRSHHIYENTEDYTMLFEASYDEVFLSGESEKEYPELADALEQFNKEKQEEALADRDSQIEAAKEQYQNDPEMFSAYQNQNSVSIRRADSEVLSLQEYGYSYAGGAHGYYAHGGTVFDAKTGQKITLQDTVADLRALADYVAVRMKELYPDLEPLEGTMEENVQNYLTGKDDYEVAWTMDPLGITIYFSPYLIGSYADGEQQVSVGFSEKPELFNGRYGEHQGAFGYSFDAGQPQLLDIDGDGVMERLEVQGVMEENDYEYYNGVDIQVNDRNYRGELFGFAVQPTLVRNAEGKYFLYFGTSQENDWHCEYLFDINGEQPFKIGEVNGKVSSEDADYSYEDGSSWQTASQLYDPDHFYLESRMQTLSTYSAVRPYRVGAAGMAEPQDLWYSVADDLTLTSKQELTLDIVDAEKGETAEAGVTLPAGTEFTIWRTDDKGFVDCKLKDGRIARVPVETGDWPQKVNGTDIEEVFDGTMFAG